MLSAFVDWAKQVAVWINGDGMAAQVIESEVSENCSARLDIDTPMIVARITCWESSDYYAEVIHVETERTIFSSHGNLQVEKAFSEQFADFFKSLDIAIEDYS